MQVQEQHKVGGHIWNYQPIIELLPKPLKDFWGLVFGQKGVNGIFLRFSVIPTFIELNDQPPPAVLQSYPLQLEIYLRLGESHKIGFAGWHAQKLIVITLHLPAQPLIKAFSEWEHHDAEQVADALKAIKAAYILWENFGLPYLVRFSFMCRDKSRVVVGIVERELNEQLKIVASKVHSDKFVLKPCWRGRYFTDFNPEVVLRGAECNNWGEVQQWLSDVVVDAYLYSLNIKGV
jgi:hypothetical protein